MQTSRKVKQKTVPGERLDLIEVGGILVTRHVGRREHNKGNCHCILDWTKQIDSCDPSVQLGNTGLV